MASRSYHPTQNLTQKQLTEYEVIAKTQDQKILFYFWEHPTTGITCDDLEELNIIGPDAPLTSIRRSLTNLAHRGNIVKTGQRTGQYDRPVNIYSFVKL